MANTTFGPINTVPQTHFKVTHQESDGLANAIYARKFAYAWDDLDAADDYYIPIDAGTTILFLTHRVTTAFAGGTPSLTVGDSAAVDTYLISADVGETSLNDVAGSLTATTPVEPKYYASANYIRICHATGLTAGGGELVVYYGA
jgi:hypothetical protein